MKPSEVNLWAAFLNFISQAMTAYLYLYLFAAILSEISAAFRLKQTDGFTQFLPTAGSLGCRFYHRRSPDNPFVFQGCRIMKKPPEDEFRRLLSAKILSF
jgi:hypothetical protein